MSEPAGPEVPAWITDLVPVADRARAVLIAELPYLLVTGVLAAGVLCWVPDLAATAAVPVLAAVEGMGLALRHGGPRRPAHHGTSTAARPGWRTTALVLTADIVSTAAGLVILAAGWAVGASHLLSGAALAATTAMVTATTGILAAEQKAWPRLTVVAVTALACAGALALAAFPGGWWSAVLLALAADGLGVLAVRAGRRRDLAGAAGRAH